MRIRFALCAFALWCLPIVAQVPAGYIPVSQTYLRDASGVLANNLSVCAQAMSGNMPASVRVGSNGGVTTTSQVCTTVSNGAWSMNLPDVSKTSPLNATFSFSAIDNRTGANLLAGYRYVQPHSQSCTVSAGTVSCTTNAADDWCTATSCILDNLAPSAPAQALIVQGPPGKTGPAGCVLGQNCVGAVLTNPAGAQGIVMPSGTPFSVNNFRGERNEEDYAGASVAARVNSAVADCGTVAPCTVVIPPTAPFGVGWTLPLPNNVVMVDQRSVNSQGFAQQTATGLRAYTQWLSYRGANYPWEEDNAGTGTFTGDFESRAYAGGDPAYGGKANAGALLLYSDRTAGNRPIWGMDLNMQVSNLNNLATGLEIDVVNNSGVDDPGATIQGLLLIASSNTPGTDSGTGLTVQGSNSLWKYGAVIESYSTVGLQMIAQTASRNADIAFLPKADDNNIEMMGRNAANTATVWSMDDSGNMNLGSVSGKVVHASQGGSIAPVIFGSIPTSGSGGLGILWNMSAGSGETDFVNSHGIGGGGFDWYNTGNGASGTPLMGLDSTGRLNVSGVFSSHGSAGMTGSCTSSTTLTVVGGIITGCS